MKYVIPILSLIISVIALAVALPRPNNLGFDYLGVIVALIAIATALAVGFQIWNALSLETRLKELKSKIDAENNTQLNLLEKKLKADYDSKVKILSALNVYSSSINAAYLFVTHKKFDEAFLSYIKALEYEIVLKKSNIVSPSIILTIIYYIDSIQFKISDPKKQKYITSTIIKSENEELISKIGIIKSKIFQSEA